jgi:hypothetical protein
MVSPVLEKDDDVAVLFDVKTTDVICVPPDRVLGAEFDPLNLYK